MAGRDPWQTGAWFLSFLTLLFLVWGHIGTLPGHLDPFTKHISQYASSAPNGWAIGVAIVTFSVFNLLIGIRLFSSRWFRRRLVGVIGGLIALFAVPIVFVAVFKTFVVGKPGRADLSWWDKLWNRIFGPPKPVPNPISKLEAHLHDQLISVPALVILPTFAILILTIGIWRDHVWMWRCLLLWLLAVSCLIGSNLNPLGLDGALQRSGFIFWIGCGLMVLRQFHVVERELLTSEKQLPCVFSLSDGRSEPPAGDDFGRI